MRAQKSPRSAGFVGVARLRLFLAPRLCLAGEALFQRVAHQRPCLVDGILAGFIAPRLCIKPLSVGTVRLAGHGESVAEHEDAEGQKLQGGGGGQWLVRVAVRVIARVAAVGVGCCEVVLTDEVRLDVLRCDARRGQPFGLDVLLDLAGRSLLNSLR